MEDCSDINVNDVISDEHGTQGVPVGTVIMTEEVNAQIQTSSNVNRNENANLYYFINNNNTDPSRSIYTNTNTIMNTNSITNTNSSTMVNTSINTIFHASDINREPMVIERFEKIIESKCGAKYNSKVYALFSKLRIFIRIKYLNAKLLKAKSRENIRNLKQIGPFQA
ncbi:hypothetical protein TCAL_16386 [Tigriopus californicus]|uniref:Uncharacterized protein n=1 Tax=Tigriopus californicus TaxID=6832 RepID=A0A553NZS2_TIGCA|nr:hypothetical protein TCAL_16386 [Tigriopus californicus]